LIESIPYEAPQTALAKPKWQRRRPKYLPPWVSALALVALAAITITAVLWPAL
jgi:hypothetical protein